MKDASCAHWQHSWRYNSVARGMPANRGDLLMRSNTHELSDDPSDTWVKQLQHSGLIKALAVSDPWHDIDSLPVSGQWWWHGFFLVRQHLHWEPRHYTWATGKVTYTTRTAKPDLLKLSPDHDFWWVTFEHVKNLILQSYNSPFPNNHPIPLKFVWVLLHENT